MTLREFEKLLNFETDYNRNDYRIDIDVSKKYIQKMIIHSWEHSKIERVNDYTLETFKNEDIANISIDNWAYLFKEFLPTIPDGFYTHADRIIIYNVNNFIDIDADDCFEIEKITFSNKTVLLKHVKG